jgi:hypothetical protein
MNVSSAMSTPSDLGTVVDALASDATTLTERRSYTLALAEFFGEGNGDIEESRLAAARAMGVSRVLTQQLHRLSRAPDDPSFPSRAPDDRRVREERLLIKRERFIYNATLSTMANLSFGGLTSELREAGAFELMMSALNSPDETTLMYAAACVQNMTNTDLENVTRFTNSPTAMKALQRLVESGEHKEDTVLNAAGALMNVSRPTLKRPTGLYAALHARTEDEANGEPLNGAHPGVDSRLRNARVLKREIKERRALGKIGQGTRIWRARRELHALRASRARELAALNSTRKCASRWLAWHREYREALRKTPPPFAELPTVWELAGGVAEGVTPCTTPAQLDERRHLVRTVQGSLHVLEGEDLMDVCAWLRVADGCSVLVGLMREDDAHVHEACTHIVANLVSSESDNPEGVRASRELLLRCRVLGALSDRLALLTSPLAEPLAAPQAAPLAELAPRTEREGGERQAADKERTRLGSEQGAMYAAAALHNLSASDNLGGDAIRASTLEAQLSAVVLLNRNDGATAAQSEPAVMAGDETRAAVVSMAARLALGTLCNLEEWSTLPTPSAAQLGLSVPEYIGLREAIETQFTAQLGLRARALHAARVMQRVWRRYRPARKARRELRAAERRAAVRIQARARGTCARVKADKQPASTLAEDAERTRAATTVQVCARRAARVQRARLELDARQPETAAREEVDAQQLEAVEAARREGRARAERLSQLPSVQVARNEFSAKRYTPHLPPLVPIRMLSSPHHFKPCTSWPSHARTARL